MKKTLILAIVVGMFCLSSCLVRKCAEVETLQPQGEISMFTTVEVTSYWRIVYHKETKVMYAVSRGDSGNFALLVNADGTPMVYQDE